MGGNGSSGGVKAGGGVKIPELTGTEKQVAWAKDILTNPHASMLATAKLQRERAKSMTSKARRGEAGMLLVPKQKRVRLPQKDIEKKSPGCLKA